MSDPLPLAHGADEIRDGGIEADRCRDDGLADLHAANLATAIANGDLDASAQLGALIGQWLTREGK